MAFVNMGFGNIINTDKILAIVSPDSAPSKRLLQTSRECGKLIDATQGRRTRSIVITETGYIVLSALQPETIASRVKIISRGGFSSERILTTEINESNEDLNKGECNEEQSK